MRNWDISWYNFDYQYIQIYAFLSLVIFVGSTPNQGKNDETRDLDDCLPTSAIEGVEKLF